MQPNAVTDETQVCADSYLNGLRVASWSLPFKEQTAFLVASPKVLAEHRALAAGWLELGQKRSMARTFTMRGWQQVLRRWVPWILVCLEELAEATLVADATCLHVNIQELEFISWPPSAEVDAPSGCLEPPQTAR